jgi:hypothetical protein
MDRQYYGLKALVIGVALAAAILGGGLECSRLTTTHNPNYQATFIAGGVIRDAGLRFGRTLGHFFSQALAGL